MLLLTPLYSTPRGCIQATAFFWMDSSSSVCTFILPLETVTAKIQSKLGRCSVAALETSNQIAFYFYSYVYLYILMYFYLCKVYIEYTFLSDLGPLFLKLMNSWDN